MRYFLISDVHGNLEGLNAVLSDMKKTYNPSFLTSQTQANQSDVLGLLGDQIGYYANPNEVMDILWPIAGFKLQGNHEVEAINITWGEIVAYSMNPYAAAAIKWTAKNLSDLNQKRIEDLSQTFKFEDTSEKLIFTHSNPSSPTDYSTYIFNVTDAKETFFEHKQFKGYAAFVGHSHVPQFYTVRNNKVEGGEVPFNIPERIVTPGDLGLIGKLTRKGSGLMEVSWKFQPPFPQFLAAIPSAGQPRDQIRYAGYAIFETSPEKRILRMVRLDYNYKETQFKEIKAGLPCQLVERLGEGR